MTYTHGLGDAQESRTELRRMTYDDETPVGPKCDCCGGETEYVQCERDGSIYEYIFICPNEDCEHFESKDFIVEIDLGWDNGNC
jgi:hypothetical protein